MTMMKEEALELGKDVGVFGGDRRSGSSTDLTSCSLDDAVIVDTIILDIGIKVSCASQVQRINLVDGEFSDREPRS